MSPPLTSHIRPTAPAPAAQARDPGCVLEASTFSAGLLLLPQRLRSDARDLYYMLRTIDDLVDERHPQAEPRIVAIEAWAHDESSERETPETLILDSLCRHHPMPREALLCFCAGMRHDLSETPIDTESDLERYCEQVAGSVGIMLAALFGTSRPKGVEDMATLGRAMQRTNILRDIDEDLENGHLYIPRSALKTYGFPSPGKREALLRDQIARADALYEQGAAALPTLRNGREAMALSTVLYREILRQIECEGFGDEPGRVTVPAWRKSQLIEQQLRTHRAPAVHRMRSA